MHVSGGAVYRSFPDLSYTCIVLFNRLIDGYYHSLFTCITFITHYYHNITQLDVKCLHLTRL